MLRGALSLLRSRLCQLRASWPAGGVRGLPSSSSSSDGRCNIFSEAEARERFEEWCKTIRRTYPSEEEKLHRFSVFKENLEILARKCENQNPGMNCFADRTLKEFNRDYPGMNTSMGFYDIVGILVLQLIKR